MQTSVAEYEWMRYVAYVVTILGLLAAVICAVLWRWTYNNPLNLALSDAYLIHSYEGWISLYRFNTFYGETAVIHYWHLVVLFCAPCLLLLVVRAKRRKRASLLLPKAVTGERENMTRTLPPLPTIPTKNWFSRNWKWLVPVGCLSPILVCGGFAAIIMAIIFGSMRSSDVYKDAVAIAKKDPAVVAALGSPIETGMLVSGKINFNGSSGEADLAIPIHGPKSSGTLYVVATKSAGRWSYSELAVKVDDSGQRLELPKSSE